MKETVKDIVEKTNEETSTKEEKYSVNNIGAVFIFLLTLFLIIYGFFTKTPDSKLRKDYGLDAGHTIYEQESIDVVIENMKKFDGIYYFGFPECPWCKEYTKFLDQAVRENGLKIIYYYNIKEDRDIESIEFNKLLNHIKSNSEFDNPIDEKEFDNHLYDWMLVPSVYVVKDGKILGRVKTLEGHKLKNGKVKLSYEQIRELKDQYYDLINKLFE